MESRSGAAAVLGSVKSLINENVKNASQGTSVMILDSSLELVKTPKVSSRDDF